MAKKPSGNPIPVESVRHKDKRANIPTEELRDFGSPRGHSSEQISLEP